jgi:CheY-like chemotaxis protein
MTAQLSPELSFDEVHEPGLRPIESDGPKTEAARRAVLIVEDDPAHRELLVEMLGVWGYETVPVGSAEEGEYAMRRHNLDAAVVDVFLPGRSGPSLISRFRERFPQAVVIGISALGDAATARRCKGVGADIFLSKPVSPDALAQALNSTHLSWH